MKTRACVASLILACGLAPATLAQSATWVLTEPVDGPAGDGILRPGEVATLKLAIDLTPSTGQSLSDGSVVTGLGSVISDFIGQSNWNTGAVTWTVNPDLVFLTGDITKYEPATHNLRNMNAGQIPDFGPFSSADPISVIDIRWDPQGVYSPRTVSVKGNIRGDIEDDRIYTYVLKPGSPYEEAALWPATDATFSFKVDVPSPGALAVLGFAAPALGRRRR